MANGQSASSGVLFLYAHSLRKAFHPSENWPKVYIDSGQSKVYSYLAMNDAEQTLNRTLHAIADPARRRILEALKERGGCSIGKDVGLCASDIELRIKLSQPTISHHMSILRKAGLVEGKKLGQWMWYRRNETALREFARILKETL